MNLKPFIFPDPEYVPNSWGVRELKHVQDLAAPWLLELEPSMLEALNEAVWHLDRALHHPVHRQQSLQRQGLADRSMEDEGAFLCYDFHIHNGIPRLVEVNSNAGGWLICAWLAGQPMDDWIVPMIRQGWSQLRPGEQLEQVWLVDEHPELQFLYPEFRLYQALFERSGLRCSIVDVQQLRSRQPESGVLLYNRLTDFYLDRYPQLHLWPMLPSPSTYAVYADKNNLVDLFAIPELSRWILPVYPVASQSFETWWSTRHNWFFKPMSGYGSKAVYRGERISRKLLGELCQRNDYVAQQYCPAGVLATPEGQLMKYDMRVYSWAGRTALISARLYQGQVTNFRTAGGGFCVVQARKG